MKRYQELVLNGRLEPDQKQLRALQLLEELYRRHLYPHEAIRKNPSPSGVYLWGEVGCGKTLLMDLLFHSLPEEQRHRVHFHEFMLEMYASLNEISIRNEKPSIHPVVQVAKKMHKNGTRVLCFDELQVTDAATCAILSQFFDALFSSEISVVFTSNKHPEKLYSGLFQRDLYQQFVRRVSTQCIVHDIQSNVDYRHNMLEGLKSVSEDSYYINQGSSCEGDKHLDARFEKLCKGSTVFQNLALETFGKQIIVPLSTEKAAMFLFEEICSLPYSASNYLMLCSQYETIFIKGIPRFSLSRKDEARRLIMLIDAIYESKVKLVCSAADIPDRLFPSSHIDAVPNISLKEFKQMEEKSEDEAASRFMVDGEAAGALKAGHEFFSGHDEMFAFRRAVSRLKEMQTVNYINERQHFPSELRWRREILFDKQPRPKRSELFSSRPRPNIEAGSENRSFEESDIYSDNSVPFASSSSDFSEEADYRGYLHMYRRHHALDASQAAANGSQASPASGFDTESIESLRERNGMNALGEIYSPPRFESRHIWGMGLWGKKAGAWGQGADALLSLIRTKK